MPSCNMQPEPPKEIWTSEDGSMAHETAITRWPGIVQGMIDDLDKTLAQSNFPAKKLDEGRIIEVALGTLKNDIRRDKLLHTLKKDEKRDIDGYNAQRGSFGEITWHNAPWLFAECYLYRYVLDQFLAAAPMRISLLMKKRHRYVQTLFGRSTYWRAYDIFARQKLSALVASLSAIEELSERYLSLSLAGALSDKSTSSKNDQFLLFSEMTQIALWGNATDLSLLSHLSLAQIHSLQGTQAIQAGQSRIVSNDMKSVWNYLDAKRGGRIDIVLDNAGFELFTDLVFALYLMDSGLAATVRLHVKSIPWFVSDVMPHDVEVLLSTMLADNNSQDADTTSSEVHGQNRNSSTHILAARLERTLFQDTRQANDKSRTGRGRSAEIESRGMISIVEHPFWTTGHDFHQLPEQAPDLMSDLRASNLVIFKGDLNYRKLVRDAKWPHTMPFKQALGPLVGAHYKKGGDEKGGIQILALRTNKADVCIGVDELTLQRVEKEAPGKAWVRNGRYAVVSFSDGVRSG